MTGDEYFVNYPNMKDQEEINPLTMDQYTVSGTAYSKQGNRCGFVVSEKTLEKLNKELIGIVNFSIATADMFPNSDKVEPKSIPKSKIQELIEATEKEIEIGLKINGHGGYSVAHHDGMIRVLKSLKSLIE